MFCCLSLNTLDKYMKNLFWVYDINPDKQKKHTNLEIIPEVGNEWENVASP